MPLPLSENAKLPLTYTVSAFAAPDAVSIRSERATAIHHKGLLSMSAPHLDLCSLHLRLFRSRQFSCQSFEERQSILFSAGRGRASRYSLLDYGICLRKYETLQTISSSQKHKPRSGFGAGPKARMRVYFGPNRLTSLQSTTRKPAKSRQTSAQQR